MGKSAIFRPTLPMGHQMYRSTAILAKSAISVASLSMGHPMYMFGVILSVVHLNVKKKLLVFTSSLNRLFYVCIVRILKVDFHIGKLISAAVLTGPFHSLVHFKANGLY